MNMSHSHVVFVAVVMSAFVFSGCGGPAGRAPIAKTTGFVKLGGAPVEGAKVSFLPIDGEIAGLFSHATTDHEGKFVMSTYGLDDGALVGRHKVTVSKPKEVIKFDPNELSAKGYSGADYEKMMGVNRNKAQQIKSDLPEKYADKDTSPIEIQVELGVDNEVPLNLTK